METKHNTADDFIKSRNYKKALQIYLEILEDDPNDTKVYQGIAYCQYQLKNYDSAVSACNKAIELDPNLAIPHTVLAYLYHRQRDLNKAFAESLKAYEISPKLEEVANCYGILLLGRGRVDESIAVLRDVLIANAGSVQAHKNLAVAYREKKDFTKCLEEMKLAYKYDPTLNRAYQLLIAYEQKYALIVAIMGIVSLFSAWLLKARIFLIVPMLWIIQVLYADFEHIVAGRWRNPKQRQSFLFSLVADCVFVAFILFVYLMIGSN